MCVWARVCVHVYVHVSVHEREEYMSKDVADHAPPLCVPPLMRMGVEVQIWLSWNQ